MDTSPWDVARTFWLGGVRPNLPKITLLIRCSICYRSLFIPSCLPNVFLLFTSGKGTRVNMPIKTFQCSRHVQYPVSIIGQTMVRPGNCFKIEVPRRQENSILNLVF